LRNRGNQKAGLDGADAVVRVSLEGLDERAALRALKLANLEAMRSLEAPTRAKGLQHPIAFKMLDRSGAIIMEMTDRGIYGPANRPITPEFLFYLVAEDDQGRSVCARIELVRQVIQ
jgi:hypothetical protein